MGMLSHCSHVQLFAISWKHRLLCLWKFSQQEYWSGLPFPTSGDLLDPGIKIEVSPALKVASLSLSHLGSPESYRSYIFIILGSLHAVLNRGYTSLLSQQECTRFPFSPHLWQYSIVFHFCHDSILVGVRWFWFWFSFTWWL